MAAEIQNNNLFNTPPMIQLPASYTLALQNPCPPIPEDGPPPFFVYGSLTLPSLVRSVTGSSLSLTDFAQRHMTAATLRGYTRYALETADYPALLPTLGGGGVVYGMLCVGLSEKDRNGIFNFEGSGYDATWVTVTLGHEEGGQEVLAMVFVWNGEWDMDLVPPAEREWTIEGFVAGGCYEGAWSQDEEEGGEEGGGGDEDSEGEWERR